MRKKTGTPESGWSMIELLIVLAVTGIIAAIAIAALANALDKAKRGATMADMRAVANAVEVYSVDFGFIPAGSIEVASLKPVLEPYQTSVLPIVDHWGHRLRFHSDGRNNYSVVSLGKDGVDGDDLTPATRHEFGRDIVLANGQFVTLPH